MKPSLKHLRDSNVSWLDHHRRAARWAWKMQKATVCLAVHSVCPWLFESYASTEIFETAAEMEDAIEAGANSENY